MKSLNMWEHRRWGNSIFWIDWSRLQISGYLSEERRLQIGDEIRDKMNNEKIGVFKVVKIEYMLDPPDKFFGTVEGIRYEEEG